MGRSISGENEPTAGRLGACVRLIACAAALLTGVMSRADDPPRPAPVAPSAEPADFKLKVALFGVYKEPTATAELVVRKGVVYQFLSETPEEVIVIDPTLARVGLIDLRRKVQAEVTSKRLDDSLGRLHSRYAAIIAGKEKAGTRADRVSAAMARDLIDPNFQRSYDRQARRLRLSNATVEVDAVGEEEPDGAHLALITNALAAVAKLGALRDPEIIPPFTSLEAIRELAVVHHLRPAEMSFIYRLTGTPKKLRWTYQLVPRLTAREVEAISRVNRLRETAHFIPYEFYEHDEEDE